MTRIFMLYYERNQCWNRILSRGTFFNMGFATHRFWLRYLVIYRVGTVHLESLPQLRVTYKLARILRIRYSIPSLIMSSWT